MHAGGVQGEGWGAGAVEGTVEGAVEGVEVEVFAEGRVAGEGDVTGEAAEMTGEVILVTTNAVGGQTAATVVKVK